MTPKRTFLAAVLAMAFAVPLGAVAQDGDQPPDLPGINMTIEIAPAPEDAPEPKPSAAPRSGPTTASIDEPKSGERPKTASEPAPTAADLPDLPGMGALPFDDDARSTGANGSDTNTEAARSNPSDLVTEVHLLRARPASTATATTAEGCPSAVTCKSYQLRDRRWPAGPGGVVDIHFAYNDRWRRRLFSPDTPEVLSALVAGSSQWERHNSNVRFTSDGVTRWDVGHKGRGGGCDDGVNVIGWKKFEAGIIGAAISCFDRSNGVVRDVDLALNTAHHWDRLAAAVKNSDTYDVQSIFTHELGHWLGLEDIYRARDTAQTMYGVVEFGEIRKRTLALGDVLGVQAAYPCGAGDSCPRTGIIDD
jgi:hypothetical protein